MKHTLTPRICRGCLQPLRRATATRSIDVPSQPAGQPTDNRLHFRRLASSLAAAATVPGQDVVRDTPLPTGSPSGLDTLLSAVRRRDHAQTLQSFRDWTTRIIGEADSDGNSNAARQVAELPPNTFSEILRGVDPKRLPELDVANGVRINLGQAKYSPNSALVEQFGRRHVHLQVLDGVTAFFTARSGQAPNFSVSDYEIAMRAAGAAIDHFAVKRYFHLMVLQGRAERRTVQTWLDFTQTRFMTDPLYYQYDRARVAQLPRDAYSNNNKTITVSKLVKLDQMRLNINTELDRPWNRTEEAPDEDVRRTLRRRAGFKAFPQHWQRHLDANLQEVGEEELCTALIALSRTGSLRSMLGDVLEDCYGIYVRDPSEPDRTTIKLVEPLLKSPPRPTVRFMEAVVEAFCCMSHIPLALQLMHFLSREYQLPIPHSVWSNLLQWTYLSASKPYRTQRDIVGSFPSTRVRSKDVRTLWDTMIAAPYNINPSFEDYDIIVKTYVVAESYGRALTLIRGKIVPQYHQLVKDHETYLLDELLHNDTGTPNPRSTHRRIRAAALKDVAHSNISLYLKTILDASSRPDRMDHVELPNLLIEFADFLPATVRYNTRQGQIHIHRHRSGPVSQQNTQHYAFRHTLPTKIAGPYVMSEEGSDQPEFDYPMTEQVRMLYKKKKPATRQVGVWQYARQERELWETVEQELML